MPREGMSRAVAWGEDFQNDVYGQYFRSHYLFYMQGP